MSDLFAEEDYVMVRCSVEVLLNHGCLAAKKYLLDKGLANYIFWLFILYSN